MQESGFINFNDLDAVMARLRAERRGGCPPYDRETGSWFGASVTLHQIVRMRPFARVAAANLRIIPHEIIEYAAITIAPRIAAKRSATYVTSLKRVGFRQSCNGHHWERDGDFRLTRLETCDALPLSNKLQ